MTQSDQDDYHLQHYLLAYTKNLHAKLYQTSKSNKTAQRSNERLAWKANGNGISRLNAVDSKCTLLAICSYLS